jgi:regulatory protein
MTGTITALQVQKRNKERVNVYLDGEYALAVTIFVASGLKKGQLLSDADIEQLESQDERNRAYNHAVFFLGFRARSQTEVEKYLRGKKYLPEVITATIERLLEAGYLNDEDFARTWVADRRRFRPRGRRALQYELRQKGLSDDDIEGALADLDEDDLARQALTSKLQQWQKFSEPDFKKKAMGHLSRRGFDYEVTRRAVAQAWASLEEA